MNCRPSGFGCGLGEITYQYRVAGELYTGSYARPFILTNSAESYISEHQVGSAVALRVNSTMPESSLVCNRDDIL
jgi:hypothetical protein